MELFDKYTLVEEHANLGHRYYYTALGLDDMEEFLAVLAGDCHFLYTEQLNNILDKYIDEQGL